MDSSLYVVAVLIGAGFLASATLPMILLRELHCESA